MGNYEVRHSVLVKVTGLLKFIFWYGADDYYEILSNIRPSYRVPIL